MYVIHSVKHRFPEYIGLMVKWKSMSTNKISDSVLTNQKETQSWVGRELGMYLGGLEVNMFKIF